MNTFGAIKLGFSGNRIIIFGPILSGTSIDMPYDPVDKRSLLIFRGQYQSLVDIDQYDVLLGKLILTSDLEQDEQLTIVYIGYDASARINFPATLGTDGKIKIEMIPEIAKSKPKNYLMNAAFSINQRVGPWTFADGIGGFVVDRWVIDSVGGSSLVTQKQNNTPSLLQYGSNSLVLKNNTTSTGSIILKQRIESSLIDFLGKPFTVSIRAVKDITDSTTSTKTVNVDCKVIYYPDNIITNQNNTQTMLPWTSIGTLTTVSQVFSVSGVCPVVDNILGTLSTTGIIEVLFRFSNTTGAGSYQAIVQQAQFTKTSSVPDFQHKNRSEDWMDCLRYYESTYSDNIKPGTSSSTSRAGARAMLANVYQTTHIFSTKKRIPPLVTIWNPDSVNTTGSGRDIVDSINKPISNIWTSENDVTLVCPLIQWNGTYRNSTVLYHLTADAEIY